jgi:hypothetical protein
MPHKYRLDSEIGLGTHIADRSQNTLFPSKKYGIYPIYFATMRERILREYHRFLINFIRDDY